MAGGVGSFWTQHRTITGLALCVLAFAEVLDLSIVAVATPQIMGGLGTNLDSISLVTTCYVVSAAVCIPLSGLVIRRYGMKAVILASAMLFGGCSALCGLATSLNEIIALRILQGIGGAFLPAVAQGYINMMFEDKEQKRMMGLFTMVVVLAPIAAPIFGGIICEHWSWRWVFFINVPVCALAFTLILVFMKPIAKQHVRIDFISFALMVIAIGSLEYFVDEGHRHSWLQSVFMIIMLATAIVFMGFFVWRGVTTSSVVNLRLFKNANFSVCCAFILFAMTGTMASMAYFPTMLQEVYGYSVETTGFLTAPRGLAALVGAPLIGLAMKRVSPKLIMMASAPLFSLGCLLLSFSSPSPQVELIFVVTLCQGIGMVGMLLPVMQLVFTGIPQEQSTDASGVFNFFRNLGVSLGAALSATIVSRLQQTNYHALGSHISPLDPAYQLWGSELGSVSPAMKVSMANMEVSTQSNLMGFLGSYQVFAAAILMVVLLPPFMARQNPSGSGAAVA